MTNPMFRMVSPEEFDAALAAHPDWDGEFERDGSSTVFDEDGNEVGYTDMTGEVNSDFEPIVHHYLAGQFPVEQTQASGLWEHEHGRRYAPPQELLELVKSGEAQDLSYHNDLCPRFGLLDKDGDEALSLWSDAELPCHREYEDTPRFMVESEGQEPFETDDVHEAIAEYRRRRAGLEVQ